MKMKKKDYIMPVTDCVNVHLYGAVMGGTDEGAFGKWSQGAAGGDVPGWADAKENSGFDLEDSFGDIWGDPSAGNDPYDLWGDN